MSDQLKYPSVGEWVGEWRRDRHLTIAAAAERVFWSPPHWHSIEASKRVRKNGELPTPTRTSAEKVALALDLPHDLVLIAFGYVPDEVRKGVLAILPTEVPTHAAGILDWRFGIGGTPISDLRSPHSPIRPYGGVKILHQIETATPSQEPPSIEPLVLQLEK